MQAGLWFALGSFALAVIALIGAFAPRALRPLAVLAAAALAVYAVIDAETPLGFGDGVVPDVRGSESCEAFTALEERGLRWIALGGRAEDRVPDDLCAPAEDGYDVDNPVVEQRPAPGTDVGEGGIVRLTYLCEVRDGCGFG